MKDSKYLPLNSVLGVGFGQVMVYQNGALVWFGDDAFEKKPHRLRHFEKRAREFDACPAYGHCDWWMYFYGPLHTELYWRDAPGKWRLVAEGVGFA